MELMAALEGLRAICIPSEVTVITDSAYLLRTMRSKWYENWIAQEESGAKPRPNMDLWHALIGLASFHDITWVKIKGHSGDYWNERADRLADIARRERVSARHDITDWEAGVRCSELSLSEQQCKLHSGHSGMHYFTSGKANGVEVYGTTTNSI